MTTLQCVLAIIGIIAAFVLSIFMMAFLLSYISIKLGDPEENEDDKEKAD